MEKTELVKAELELVLRSIGFQRSARHARFLRFVCEATLDGEAAQLNEYLIAHRVFERGPDYSPGEDSVVRRQAYSVRQKLQEYYNEAGKDDAVRIELPVGRYVPVFQFVEPRVELAPETVETEARTAVGPVFRWKWWMAGTALVAVGIGVGWLGAARSMHRGPVDPAFAQVWGPWLSSDGNVICFSNALTAGIRRTEEPFPEDTLTRGIALNDDQAAQIRRRFQLPAGGFFYMNPAMAHAKMGEALGSIPLTAMFARAGVPVRATQSRYLNWQDFRNQNLILLGHDEANQWLDPILSRLPYRLARTSVNKPRRIVVGEPKAGERGEYYPDYSRGLDPPAEDYALVSFLNGFDGHHGLALVNGVNTEGTMMALEYLTDPVSLRTLEAALRKESRHGAPWRFQVILHSELRDGVPSGIEVVGRRVLE
ncbi:MAG TPA: hypothetical protein VGL72_01490 [Bryobacteraceae bacterium]